MSPKLTVFIGILSIASRGVFLYSKAKFFEYSEYHPSLF